MRARLLDADGVAGGEELMARLVVSLTLARFLVNCAINFLSFFRYFCSILRPSPLNDIQQQVLDGSLPEDMGPSPLNEKYPASTSSELDAVNTCTD